MTLLYENVMAAPGRLYPEVKLWMEQAAHRQLDQAFPDVEFIERGQEWVKDPYFPNSNMLKVWGIGASTYVLVIEEIAYTSTRAVGPFQSQEEAEEVAERNYWSKGIGAHVVPLGARE